MKISKDVLDERSELTQAKGLKNQEKNITTMKRYIKPTIEFIEVETAPILDGSIWMGGNLEAIDNPEEEQLGKEHRGDWDNIWGNM